MSNHDGMLMPPLSVTGSVCAVGNTKSTCFMPNWSARKDHPAPVSPKPCSIKTAAVAGAWTARPSVGAGNFAPTAPVMLPRLPFPPLSAPSLPERGPASPRRPRPGRSDAAACGRLPFWRSSRGELVVKELLHSFHGGEGRTAPWCRPGAPPPVSVLKDNH